MLCPVTPNKNIQKYRLKWLITDLISTLVAYPKKAETLKKSENK